MLNIRLLNIRLLNIMLNIDPGRPNIEPYIRMLNIVLNIELYIRSLNLMLIIDQERRI